MNFEERGERIGNEFDFGVAEPDQEMESSHGGAG